MRTFFGSILLILVIVALIVTAFYNWSINSNLDFELRDPNEPEKNTEVINMNQRAAANRVAAQTTSTPQNETAAEQAPAPTPAAEDAATPAAEHETPTAPAEPEATAKEIPYAEELPAE